MYFNNAISVPYTAVMALSSKEAKMDTLNGKPACRNRRAENGSTLIGVIGLCIVMSIACMSYLNISASAAHNELSRLRDQEAFWAAESGILMGARYIKTLLVFPTGGSFSCFTPPLTINNHDVYVSAVATTAAGVTTIVLTSEAHKDPTGSHIHDATTFRKRIRCNFQQSNYGQYGHFFNAANASWPGFYRRIFEGRFHMNRYIYIYSSSLPGSANEVIFRNGLVTCANGPGDRWNYGAGSHHGNNYDYGLRLGWSGGTAAQCDQIMRDRFLANQQAVALPTSLISQFPSSDTIKLPVSQEGGEAYNHYRPTLEFKVTGGVAQAVYHYKNASGVKMSQTFNTDGKIFVSSNHLNVFGTVKGKTTVATIQGKSIFPVRDLVYEDYDAVTGTIPPTSNNMLGLVAGKNIRYNHQWRRDLTGSSATQETISGTLDINASCMAVETDGTDSYGCEYWDWNNTCNYNLKLTGNHILRYWRQPTSGGGAAGILTFIHDLRMVSRGLQPPGFPQATAQDGTWLLTMNGWTEEDVF